MIVIVTDLVARYTPPTPARTPWITLSNPAASWRRRGGCRTGAARRLDVEELVTVMVSFGLFLGGVHASETKVRLARVS